MSGFPFLGILDLSLFISQRPYRVIDPDGFSLLAEVTVSEHHEDALIITEHPVEQGATISDHAFKRPAQLRLHVGWSAAYVGGDVAQIYSDVLTLQAQRRPFTVYTGKRLYSNMLVAELRTETNSRTAFAFLADIELHEVILVNTQVVAGNVATQSSQLAMPQKNLPTQNSGSVQTLPRSVDAASIAAGRS